jgi:hypothetical protein
MWFFGEGLIFKEKNENKFCKYKIDLYICSPFLKRAAFVL